MDIFVVDDERVIAERLAIILRQEGYEVQTFTNPSVALAACHLNPKLLLTDHCMPLVSGTDLVRAFRQRSPTLATVVLSASLEESNPEWRTLVADGAETELLRKPLHPIELLRSVARAIGQPRFKGTCANVAATTPVAGNLSDPNGNGSRFAPLPMF